MDMPVTGFWAKLTPRHQPTSWHGLAEHSHDVAACAEALLNLPIVNKRLARLAGHDTLPHTWVARLCVLAFLHDLGKANHAFQDRLKIGMPGFQGQTGGHINEAVTLLHYTGQAQASGLTRLDPWFADTDEAMAALATILAHHGAPPPADTDTATRFSPYWEKTKERDPLAGVAELVVDAAETWPLAFEDAQPVLPTQPEFWHGFLGLLQLADWLGSDAGKDAFAFAEPGEEPRRARAKTIASRLMGEMGLDVSRFRAGMKHGEAQALFETMTGFTPHPMQLAAALAAGEIVSLEAETGSGKTEAALLRFFVLFALGRVDGLYFALPTRVAATQMVARVQAAVARMFPDAKNRPVVVRALPGDVSADGANLKSLPDFDVQWSDETGSDEAGIGESDEAGTSAPDNLRRRRWAAEAPKRFLAAPIAVGTIDQALLGAVRVKHAQMRSFCLSRSLLVVDEVHASDEYSTEILGNLLKQHRGAGGEALLLSATLGAEARTRLLLGQTARQVRQQTPDLQAACTIPYPAVSSLEGTAISSMGYGGSGRQKQVSMVPLMASDAPVWIAERALAAARAGAKVLVIRNVVGDAVATREALEALAPGDSLLFRLDGVATLHHGRFAREDRRLLDGAVERELGKAARDAEQPGAGGLVIVGTQTLEISLDIDADLLITDLCPVDVLLQRIGRLHRHDRPRPPGFSQAECIVLTPHGFEAVLASQKHDTASGPHGHGTVYPDIAILEATKRLIGAGCAWQIPAMNRELVERATHPQAIKALLDELADTDPRWQAALERRVGLGIAENLTGRAASVKWNRPVWEFSLQEEAATRLGARNVELVFDPPLIGAFGQKITRLVIPNRLNKANAFEPDTIRQQSWGFTFGLGDKQFIYDGMGLRHAAEART